MDTLPVAATGHVESSRREPIGELGPRGEIRQPRWADEIMGEYF